MIVSDVKQNKQRAQIKTKLLLKVGTCLLCKTWEKEVIISMYAWDFALFPSTR